MALKAAMWTQALTFGERQPKLYTVRLGGYVAVHSG